MNTDTLIKRCIEKDASAWDEFVRNYNGLVTRSVRYKLNKVDVYLSKNEYKDVVQEVFLYIWEKEKLATLKDARCFKVWLVTVTLNRTASYCRGILNKAKRTTSLDGNISSDDPSRTLASVVPCNKFNTAKLLKRRELQEILAKGIAKLQHRQRRAFKLCFFDGITQKNVAKIMGVAENTVASMISRAKKQLRQQIREYVM